MTYYFIEQRIVQTNKGYPAFTSQFNRGKITAVHRSNYVWPGPICAFLDPYIYIHQERNDAADISEEKAEIVTCVRTCEAVVLSKYRMIKTELCTTNAVKNISAK